MGNFDLAHWRAVAQVALDKIEQNMLLTARALGLGSVLTIRQLLYEKDVKEALGTPENAETFAILPIGWPMGKFGPVSRAPVEKVTF
jgi:nitroreductase